MSIPQKLYNSEINFEISTFWDAWFSWKLGDPINGYSDVGMADTYDEALQCLHEAALHHYPASEYAQECAKVVKDIGSLGLQPVWIKNYR